MTKYYKYNTMINFININLYKNKSERNINIGAIIVITISTMV